MCAAVVAGGDAAPVLDSAEDVLDLVALAVSVAIAQKIGVVETAVDFLARRAGKARSEDMLPFLEKAKREVPPLGDEKG